MKALSLFAGCGGCSLGLRQAGFQVKLAVDIDTDACNTYSANLDHQTVVRADLASTQADDLLAWAGLGANEVDLIVGGPPCQGFSSAGARDWTDPRNTLLRRFVEIVTELRPTWFIMENVEGLLTAKEGYYIIEVITRFLEAGYWVGARKVYMESHGLPQRRKRVLIVGNLEECDFDFPDPVYHEYLQLPLFEQHPQLNILDAIDDLPEPTASGEVCYAREPQNAYQAMLRRTDGRNVLLHHARQVNEVIQQRISLIGQGETMKHLPEELQHASFSRRAFRRVMDGTPTEKRGGAPSGLKRLVAAQPALTMTSASPVEFIHPVHDRLLTLRECARIQSFPDWYTFSGSWTSIATQIGNAIPPLLMYKLAAHIQDVASWSRRQDTRGRWLGIKATKSEGKSPILAAMLARLEDRTHAYTR